VDGAEGYGFPHGIDVNFDILAVTNYGTNTVEPHPLPGYPNAA
jgi:hypothetical protein